MSEPQVAEEPDEEVFAARLQAVIDVLRIPKPRLTGWWPVLNSAWIAASNEYQKFWKGFMHLERGWYDWLPTAEFIPPIGKRVLVVRPGAVQEVMTRAISGDDRWAWYCPSSGYWHNPSIVTHWRELPSPPELSIKSIA